MPPAIAPYIQSTLVPTYLSTSYLAIMQPVLQQFWVWFDFSSRVAVPLVQNDPAWLAFMVEINTTNVISAGSDLHFCHSYS